MCSTYVDAVTRQQVFVAARLLCGTVLAVVAARASAREVGERERAGWDPHYGDPDGESIAQLMEFLTGVGVFVAVIVAVGLFEFGLWLLRREAARSSATALYAA